MARPRRIERFKITTFTNRSGTKSWRVTGTLPSGKRVRENFDEKVAAFDRKAELDGEAAGAQPGRTLRKTSLTAEQIADAESAFKSSGVPSLARLVSHYMVLERRVNEFGVSLDKAVSFAQAHYRPEITELTILNARNRFLQTRGSLSQKSLRHYTNSTGILLKLGANKPLHTINVLDLEKVLSKYENPNSQRTYRTGISVFFNWAVRHYYALDNPCERLDKIPQDKSQIAILSLKDAKRTLKAAMLYAGGSMVAPLAIALFAGLRPSEIEDLEPSDINSSRIRVTGGKMRRKINRNVPISPNLSEWLNKYPFHGLPPGAERKFKVIKAAVAAENWKQDILRHTSISYQVERDENRGKTALNCGTSEAMIDRHYRDIVEDPKEVAEFWALTSAKMENEKIELELPSRKRVVWPTDSRLAKMVNSMRMVDLAKSLLVSDVAVRKHCRRQKIPIPDRRLRMSSP